MRARVPVRSLPVIALLSALAVSLAVPASGQPEATPQEAQRLNQEVVRLYRQGRYDEALTVAQRALAIREKVLAPEHSDVATSLNNLALLYDTKGDHGQAELLYQRALAIREKVLGPDHPDVAISLNNLAALYATKGDYGQAEPLHQRALAIREKVLGPEHPDVAQSLNNLALLYVTKGDYGRAEPLYQQALVILEKMLGPEHPDVATPLNNLAGLYWAKGDLTRTVALAARAAEIREHNLRLILATGVEDQKRAYVATLAGETDAAVSLHAHHARQDREALRLALTTALRRKGRVLDAMADSLAAVRRQLRAEDRALFGEWAAARAELAALMLKGRQGASLAQVRARITALTTRAEQLETRLAARSSELRVQTQAVTVERVQQAIPAGAALIELLSYRPFDPRARTTETWWGASRFVAYVLRDRGEPGWVDLGSAAPIDQLVTQLRTALAGPDRGDVTQLARALDERVMRPVRPLLGESRLLILSPDGALNLVPFGALVDEAGRHLVDRFTFTYVTSGRDLLRFGTPGPRRSGPLVIADPDFDDGGPLAVAQGGGASARGWSRRSADFSAMRFLPLPGTASEGTALGKVLPGVTLLTRAAATEAALKKAQAPIILHVATHGFFLADQTQTPATTRRDIGITADTFAQAQAQWIENPLLRSGLALAGANRLRSGDEDGVLTGLEASGLDLRGTKLVVLSACETGVGKVQTGEGVYGLRRSLVMAGAESQVMSLWKVADEPTRDLMVSFYRKLLAGQGRAEALRQAQLEMLWSADRSHPFYWAAFIAGGDWRPLDGLTRP